jgi:hypothetical protein
MPVWRWLQRRRAANWPIAEGHIESAEVTEPRPTLFSTSRSSSYLAELGYSYSIAGSVEAGWHRRECPTAQEAREFIRDLKGKPVAVHYNPNKPSSSSLSEPSLDMLLRSRAPMLDGESFIDENSIPEWSRPFLWVFVWISVIGLILSLWVHIGALMGRRVVPEAFFGILGGGIFIVWFPALLTARSMVQNVSHKYFWKVALKGSPEWMRYMVYGFFGYAIVNFLLFMTRASGGGNGPNPPAVVWRAFSGHWMAFYSAAIASLYAAAHPEHNY